MLNNATEIIASNEFANISTFLSAIASIGAVIVALYLANTNKKPQVDIYGYNGRITSLPNVKAYIIHITNKSPNLKLIITSPLYVLTKKHIIKRKQNGMIFSTNEQLDSSFSLPKSLNYGEQHIFFLLIKQIKSILDECKYNKIIFTISDTVGHKFKYKVNRKELQKIIIDSKK